jgi:hypothetical protein
METKRLKLPIIEALKQGNDQNKTFSERYLHWIGY